MLVSSALDGIGRIWHRSGKLHKMLKGHQAPLLGVRFNKSGILAVSACVDGSCTVWKVDTGEVVRRYAHHRGAAMDAAWRDNDLFATAGTDGKIFIYSAKETAPQNVLTAHTVRTTPMRNV